MGGAHLTFERLLVRQFSTVDTAARGCLAKSGDGHELPVHNAIRDLEVPFVFDLVNGEKACMGDGLVGDHFFVGFWSLLQAAKTGKVGELRLCSVGRVRGTFGASSLGL